LQNELVSKTQGPPDRSNVTNPASANPNTAISQPRQLGLLSAAFIANPLSVRTAGSLGRNILSAGDRLRDLIVPDALAAVVSAPAWMPSMGLGGKKNGVHRERGPKGEKLRAELDEMLAGNCPLCESVVAGLDKPFVKEGEMDTTWAL
jgi:hypothetical protein